MITDKNWATLQSLATGKTQIFPWFDALISFGNTVHDTATYISKAEFILKH